MPKIEIDAPTEIVEGLWQAGENVSAEWLNEHHIGVVIDLCGRGDPREENVPCCWRHVEFIFGDSLMEFVDETQLRRLAQFAANRWSAGRNVLIHCQMGWNRSGLLMGLVLMLLNEEDSVVTNVVEFIQARRKGALSNPDFANFLLAEQGLAVREIPDRWSTWVKAELAEWIKTLDKAT